jgi:hypothetical protein
MFANLYWEVKSLHFQDHNFRSWGHGIQKMPESHIVQLIKGSCDVPDRHEDAHAYDAWVEEGFELETIFEQTLSRRACVGFFRAEPSVPALERDYYLSKLFQFLWLIAMECHEFLLTAHRDWVRSHYVELDSKVLENFLDSLPEDATPEQLAEFKWQSFRVELCNICTTQAVEGELLRALGDLHRFLPSSASQAETPAIPKSAGSRREAVRRSVLSMTFSAIQEWWSNVHGPELLKHARSAHGHVQKEAAVKCGAALETYKKWESAKRTPSKSKIPGVVDYIEASPAKLVIQLSQPTT